MKIDFTMIEENWSHYRLEDGTVIKLRLVVSEIFKLHETDPLIGEPQFLAKSSNIMVAGDAPALKETA